MFDYLQNGSALADPPEEEEIDDDLGPDENEQALQEINRPLSVSPAPSYLQADSPFQDPITASVPPSVNYPVFRPSGAVEQPGTLSVPVVSDKTNIGAPTQPDAIGSPTPIGSDIGPEPNLPPASPRVVGKDTTYAGALKTLAEIEAQRPQMTPPKWWQKGLAAGLGGAAGWSNAAGRARPIDISSATENILHPGYKTKLEEWQNKVIPAQQQAEILGQQLSSQRASEIAQSQEQLRQAQSIQAMQHGAYWQNRSEQERNQWKIDPKSGNLYNTINAQVVPKAQTAVERGQIYDALGGKDAKERLDYSLTGKLTTEHPPTEQQVKDNQIKADYATAIGKDPETVSDAEMNIARRMFGTGDPLIGSHYRAFIAQKHRLPNPAEERQIVDGAVSQRANAGPNGIGPASPTAIPPSPQSSVNPTAKFSVQNKPGVGRVISDGKQWWPIDSPTGADLARQVGAR